MPVETNLESRIMALRFGLSPILAMCPTIADAVYIPSEEETFSGMNSTFPKLTNLNWLPEKCDLTAMKNR